MRLVADGILRSVVGIVKAVVDEKVRLVADGILRSVIGIVRSVVDEKVRSVTDGIVRSVTWNSVRTSNIKIELCTLYKIQIYI